MTGKLHGTARTATIINSYYDINYKIRRRVIENALRYRYRVKSPVIPTDISFGMNIKGVWKKFNRKMYNDIKGKKNAYVTVLILVIMETN